MKAAFGDAVVRTDIFDAREMPHGATRARTDAYFILHAPHAASCDSRGSRSVLAVSSRTLIIG